MKQRTSIAVVSSLLMGIALLAVWMLTRVEPAPMQGPNERPHVDVDSTPVQTGAPGESERVVPIPFEVPDADVDEPSSRGLKGVVVGEGGAPVPSARVAVSFVVAGEPGEVPPVLTDLSGRFELPLPPGSHSAMLVVTAEGYSPTTRAGLSFAGRDIRVLLRRSIRLSGHVSDSEGRPIQDATVSLTPRVSGVGAYREIVVENDGFFRFDDVGGDVIVQCRAPGFASKTVFSRYLARDTVLDIVFLRATSLVGRVLREVGQRPCPGARIELWRCEAHFGQGSDPISTHLETTTSGEDGRFHLGEVPAVTREHPLMGGSSSHLALWIQVPECAPVWLRLPVSEAPERDVGDVLVHEVARIEGRVVDSEGAFVPGARVLYLNDRTSHLRSLDGRKIDPLRFSAVAKFPPTAHMTVLTDEDGVYGLDVPVGLVPHPGFVQILPRVTRPLRVEVIPRQGVTIAAPDLVLPVPASARFHAQVLDGRTGVAVEGARITDWGPDVFTDIAGRFSLPLFPGPPMPQAPVMIIREGYVTLKIVVDPSRTSPSAPAIIELAPAVSLRGLVVDANGRALKDALVRVFDGRLDPATVLKHRTVVATPGVYAVMRTDADGAFSSSRLPDGPYHVVALYPALSNEPVAGIREFVPAGSFDLLIRLDVDRKVPRTLRVRFVGETTGEPLDLAEPPLVVVQGIRKPGTRSGPGLYHFEDLEAQEATVIVPAANRTQSVFKGVELRDDIREFRLPDQPSIVASIVYPSGFARTRVTFDITNPAVDEFFAVGHPIDGSMTIFGLPPGTYSISLSPSPRHQFRIEGSDPLLLDVTHHETRTVIRLLPPP